MISYFSPLHSPWSPSNITAIALALSAFLIIVKIVYRLAYSPLRFIPGPWYAAVSDFWLLTHVVRLRQCFVVDKLFEQYGPVVRIGPNKVAFVISRLCAVSIVSINSIKAVTLYKAFLTNDNDHAMTTLRHSAHATRKRGYSPHYMPSNLALFQPEIQDSTLELIRMLGENSGRTKLDCLVLFRHLLVDIISAVSFEYHVGALGKYALGVEEPLTTAINDFPKRGVLRGAVPSWAWSVLCRIPIHRWQQICDSDKIMAGFVSSRVYGISGQIKAGIMDESHRPPLAHRLLNHNIDAFATADYRNIISECMGHLIAGVDTSSNTLSYLFWELSRRPDILKKLQHELDEVMTEGNTIPDITTLQSLPYLAAFLKEGLRRYGAAPSLLERVVPRPKVAGDAGFDLLGFSLPAGVVVATQAWSMHRDPTVFADPDAFEPNRWLINEPDVLARMHAHMIPFGVGSRVCGGQNLAQLVLRIVVASIVRNFDIVAPGETTEKSMEICDAFVIFPASMRCNVWFKPREY